MIRCLLIYRFKSCVIALIAIFVLYSYKVKTHYSLRIEIYSNLTYTDAAGATSGPTRRFLSQNQRSATISLVPVDASLSW